ncbi:MAG: hypothetical protein ACRDKW_09145 [Actinomycetota bacterium]
MPVTSWPLTCPTHVTAVGDVVNVERRDVLEMPGENGTFHVPVQIAVLASTALTVAAGTISPAATTDANP